MNHAMQLSAGFGTPSFVFLQYDSKTWTSEPRDLFLFTEFWRRVQNEFIKKQTLRIVRKKYIKIHVV